MDQKIANEILLIAEQMRRDLDEIQQMLRDASKNLPDVSQSASSYQPIPLPAPYQPVPLPTSYQRTPPSVHREYRDYRTAPYPRYIPDERRAKMYGLGPLWERARVVR